MNHACLQVWRLGGFKLNLSSTTKCDQNNIFNICKFGQTHTKAYRASA